MRCWLLLLAVWLVGCLAQNPTCSQYLSDLQTMATTNRTQCIPAFI
jgi:hypothetical protein